MIHDSLSYITDVCEQDFTPPSAISSFYDLLLLLLFTEQIYLELQLLITG